MANMDTDGFPGTNIFLEAERQKWSGGYQPDPRVKTNKGPADTIMQMQRLIDNEWSRKGKANEEIIDAIKELLREDKEFTAGAVRDMLEVDYPWLIEGSDALQLAGYLMNVAVLEFKEESK